MKDDFGSTRVTGLASVIVPLYNSAASICRCLNSILGQTYRDLEIIVVDDGSTDNGLEVISQYGNKITLLRQANKGPATARNFGIRESHGEYLAFLDSDDYWLPTFLEKSIAVLDHLPQAVAVSTAARAVHWTGSEAVVPGFIDTEESVPYRGGKIIPDFFEFWAREDHIRTGTVVINTVRLPELLFQREDLRISEDLEYWGLLATYGDWAFLPEVLFVTDGTFNAAARGWLQKNKVRRKLCPTVEQWQQRIFTHLPEEDFTDFKMMRGKIAGNFSHAKILAGNDRAAKEIVRNYGNDFRSNSITGIMNIGLKWGNIGWKAACTLLRLRERIKALTISIKRIRLK